MEGSGADGVPYSRFFLCLSRFRGFSNSAVWHRPTAPFVRPTTPNDLMQQLSPEGQQVVNNLAQRHGFSPDPRANWWPAELASPNATGEQNNMRYAYFASARRLAVESGGEVWVYDTLDHQIGGFSQQQGLGTSIDFNSQFGAVNLSNL